MLDSEYTPVILGIGLLDSSCLDICSISLAPNYPFLLLGVSFMWNRVNTILLKNHVSPEVELFMNNNTTGTHINDIWSNFKRIVATSMDLVPTKTHLHKVYSTLGHANLQTIHPKKTKSM